MRPALWDFFGERRLDMSCLLIRESGASPVLGFNFSGNFLAHVSIEA
jgi:hypothetical protein